jgi:uncharacterized protein (TIGR02284 family)
MANPNDHAVHVLNGLIETTLDSADGYRKAAEKADNPRFKDLFETRARKREQLTSDLKAEVRTFGGEPKDDGTMLAATHRAFLDLKDKIAGADDRTTINEVERGEDVIRDKFEKATRDTDLPVEAKQVVQRAYATVKADHDEISALKHQLS